MNDSPIWKQYDDPYELIDVLVSLKSIDLTNWCRAFGIKESYDGYKNKQTKSHNIFEYYFKRPANVEETSYWLSR
tara:strand:+ start:464 stop:688 length:225 start_codon:yes stop_codon:yes gene_type:complete